MNHKSLNFLEGKTNYIDSDDITYSNRKRICRKCGKLKTEFIENTCLECAFKVK